MVEPLRCDRRQEWGRLDRIDDERSRGAAEYQDRSVHGISAAEPDQHPARVDRQFHHAGDVLGRQQSRRIHRQTRTAGLKNSCHSRRGLRSNPREGNPSAPRLRRDKRISSHVGRREMNSGSSVLLRTAAIAFVLLALPAIAQTGGIPGVIAPGDTPQLVQENFTFLEGPVGTADGGLIFSDIRVNKTYRLDPTGKISVIAENTDSSNGLALTKAGELVRAEG